MAQVYYSAMTSVGRAAVVILFLAAVAAAEPLARGTRFGMVGFDYRSSTGDIYHPVYPDPAFVHADPFFRVGVIVNSRLALGADLALFNTFPQHGDIFLNTPVFAFVPTATWFGPGSTGIQSYTTAGAGVAYDFLGRLGWRVRIGAGALFDVGLPVTFGPEAGWYLDFVRLAYPYGPDWLTGSTLFIGVRLSDHRP